MRKAVAAVLFMLSGAFLLLAVSALSQLLDDYKDSPDSMFINAAAKVAAIGVVFLIAGAFALRERPKSRNGSH